VLSLGAYLGSLAAPSDYKGWLGIHWFLAGLLCIWAIHVTFAWWANVLYWIALGYYCRGDQSLAAKWALAAAGLAMSWALLNTSAIRSPAFSLWSGSMAVLGAGSLVLVKAQLFLCAIAPRRRC
jgi:hypothetical protein